MSVNSLSTGVDIIEIDRVREAIKRHGKRFLNKVYTDIELFQTNQHPASLAARFAAKEAVSKALGCGIGPVSWREIEIRLDSAHRPKIYLSGSAAEYAANLGLDCWQVSLSHSQTLAVAFVIAYHKNELISPGDLTQSPNTDN
jgi:holo-[acyl-carrier protein] synthase